MACNKPFMRFFRRGTADRQYDYSVPVPCGRCAACRRDLVTMWADRCTFEMQYHKDRSTFLTLTYTDDNLPSDNSVHPEDWKHFKDRLRKNLGKFPKYYMTAEYGTQSYRPHYHAMLFGLDWQKKKVYEAIEKAWSKHGKPLGYISVSYLNPSRVRYCLKYMEKEYNSKFIADCETLGLAPIFHFMSKGIGRQWFFRPQEGNRNSWWLLCKRKVTSFASLLSRFVRLRAS